MQVSWQQQAQAELERRYRRRAELPIVDFVPATVPGYMPPEHLAPYGSVLDRIKVGPEATSQSVATTAPPRHSKTETTLAKCAQLLRRFPKIRIAYACYGQELAWSHSRKCYEFARLAGVRFKKGRASSGRWETEAGGEFFATGVSGTLTGKGFDLLVVDDPHKDRAEAESPLKRRRIFEWFTDTARNRLEPGGTTIVTHTRWHPDDLIGRLLAQDKARPEAERVWTYLPFPAVREDGTSLWPQRWPLEALLAHRADGEYAWWSLYMCSPRPRGEAVFKDAHFFKSRPTQGVRYAIGVDLAYTASTQADYSVAVVMAECAGVYYVLDVIRAQCAAPEFAGKLQTLCATWPNAKVMTYAYGPEKGSADFIKKDYVKRLIVRQAPGDKFVRAQGAAASWNAGKILVPDTSSQVDSLLGADLEEDELVARLLAETPDVQDTGWQPTASKAPWVAPFVGEVTEFTGIADANDDQVDAFVAAFDLLAGAAKRPTKPNPEPHTYHSPLAE